MVTHIDRGDINLSLEANAQEIFNQSINAISEAIIWSKSKETVGVASSFSRQIGIVDVKAFIALDCHGQRFGWYNPSFMLDKTALQLVLGMMPKTIMLNGPMANPVPNATRRALGAVDLLNLGFFTESFITIFALADDLTQEVIKAGLTQRGLDESEKKQLMRVIKEDRLDIYLRLLAKLCGWRSLAEEDKSFFVKVKKINTMRNDVMHGSARLSQTEAIEAVDVMLKLISWLRANPFGFIVPAFPKMVIAKAFISIVPLKEDQAQVGTEPENSQNDPPPIFSHDF